MQNKKIGILTLHNSYNYGAVLQAYATYYYVKKLGYRNVEMINYENEYEKSLKDENKYIFQGNIKSIIKKLIQYKVFGKNRNLKKAFKNFYNDKVNLSKVYKKEELENTKYDILISGSDQIWNPKIFNGIDDSFFLDFSENAKKISIASSAGSYTYLPEEKSIIQKMLSKYSAISVREKSLKKQLDSFVKKSIFVSVDPTLLLSHEEWIISMRKEKKCINDKYILLYLVAARLDEYEDEIRELKSRINLPIYMITSYHLKFKNIDKNIVGATPEQFIELINNAQYIITNSFHGCAFSVNFNKKFIALENHSNPVRVYDFLSSIGLEDRIVKNSNDAIKVNIDFSYSKYNDTLKKIISESQKWIEEKLNEE